MYKNRSLLIKELAKTFGFYQTTNPDYSTISPSLSSSTQNRWVNQVNGLISPENIQESITSFMTFPFDAWSGDTITYAKGDVFTDNGVNYEAIQNVPTGIDITDTAYWFELDEYNNYLHQKRFQAAELAIDTVFNGKKIRNKVKSIYENIPLYDGRGNFRDKQANGNNFVGLSFVMKHDRSLVTTIKKLGHQFSEAIAGTLPIYLYHSSQEEPIATFNVIHDKANSSIWTTLTDDGTNELRYLDDNYDAGGRFWLGYAQSDLGTAQAINMYGIDWYSGFSCQSCNKRSYQYWKNYSPWVAVDGFTVPESNFTVGVDRFDPDDVSYTPSRNYGLNIQMTNDCDLTPFTLQHDYVFAEAMNNVCGKLILEDMASNTRGANGLANQVNEEANKQLYNVEGVFGTVADKVEQSLKGLSFDLSGLQDECLACDDDREDIMMSTVTFR
jgi:hypothetical protein